jgi:hypothetical protein
LKARGRGPFGAGGKKIRKNSEMAHSNAILSIPAMFAKVLADCQGVGQVQILNGKIHITPPAEYNSGHTFADHFYDYDEYKSAGYILDGNSDHTEFWLDPVENLCAWCDNNYSGLRLVVLGNSDDEEFCCKNCWFTHQLEDEGYSCTGDDFSDDEE